MKFWTFLFFLTIHICAFGQKSKKIHWSEMEKMLADPSDSLTVINFWATWCKPCVAEIPDFENAAALFKQKPVRFWFISLDFEEFQKIRLDSFIKRNGIKSKVFLLDDINYSRWIAKVDSSWSGAIPATLIVNNSKKIRQFFASEINLIQLQSLINSNLK